MKRICRSPIDAFKVRYIPIDHCVVCGEHAEVHGLSAVKGNAGHDGRKLCGSSLHNAPAVARAEAAAQHIALVAGVGSCLRGGDARTTNALAALLEAGFPLGETVATGRAESARLRGATAAACSVTPDRAGLLGRWVLAEVASVAKALFRGPRRAVKRAVADLDFGCKRALKSEPIQPFVLDHTSFSVAQGGSGMRAVKLRADIAWSMPRTLWVLDKMINLGGLNTALNSLHEGDICIVVTRSSEVARAFLRGVKELREKPGMGCWAPAT